MISIAAFIFISCFNQPVVYYAPGAPQAFTHSSGCAATATGRKIPLHVLDWTAFNMFHSRQRSFIDRAASISLDKNPFLTWSVEKGF